MNQDSIVKIFPNPSFPKREKEISSLWQREVGRDFIKMFSNC